MIRETGFKRQEINIFFDNGGLGDNIARLPVIPWILSEFPHIYLHIFVHDYFVPVAINALRQYVGKLMIYPWSKAKQYYNTEHFSKSFAQSYPRFENLSQHMTTHSFLTVANKLPVRDADRWMSYLPLELPTLDLSQFALPKSYVVVTTAFTAPSREFSPEHVNALVNKIKASGNEVVFLGQKQTQTGTEHTIQGNLSQDVDFSQGLDLIDKTMLLEAAKILGSAKAVVGLDNGLIHLAAQTSVPIVAGFTTVDPLHRVPWRDGVFGKDFHSVVPKNLDCVGCQSNMVFLAGHDFRQCYYGDFRCVKELTAELYWEKLEPLL
jgi:ADP-heptose:LPS heptosyltransferase